ncbi:hypothetical protein F9K78_08155 [Brucella pseudintermedia]|jgi:hypothetical protein|nr:hypothetical protein F9K78_08155 [Brucella pseudintermedia]
MIAAIPAKPVRYKQYGLHRDARAVFLLAKAAASTASWPVEHRICGFSDTLASQPQIATATCGEPCGDAFFFRFPYRDQMHGKSRLQYARGLRKMLGPKP